MARRSLNSTKGGRYINPSDQARKEARKRELKKNKKQRLAVRHAVLKSKEPLQLLEETSLYDKQEYDPSVQTHLNERVIQEKRKRLLETFDRLVILYRKENPEYASRLTAARHEYDKRRHEMMLYYEQVKLAERVKTSEIPLPKLPQLQVGLMPSDIPLPISLQAKSILKKSAIPGLPPTVLPIGKLPPAPPPGTPPELSDSEGEDEESGSNDIRQRKIRFADSDYMYAQNDFISNSTMINSKFMSGFSNLTPLSQIPLPPPTALPPFNGIVRPGFTGAPQSTPSRLTFHRSAVLSAPPSIHTRDPLDNADLISGPAVNNTNRNQVVPTGTTIEAKPQLKNLIGDATRFVPTALKVRRTIRDANGRLITTGGGVSNAPEKQGNAVYDRIQRYELGGVQSGTANSKDDAYEDFMREMEGIL